MYMYFFIIKLALKLQRAGHLRMSKVAVNLLKGF